MAIHFAWTKDMSVGEDTIDAQHQKLLAQLNTVIDAMVYGPASEQVASAVHFFEVYANEHLAYEEEYMERRGYSELEHHKELHQKFRDTYSDFKLKLATGTTPEAVLIQIESFLGEWWTGHIAHEDHKYYLELGAAK